MHATGRAFAPYSNATGPTVGDVAGYWYWRYSATARTEHDEPCIEVVHTFSHAIVKCSGSTPARGAKLANALNRAYASIGAPHFNEDNGNASPPRNGYRP